MAGERSHLSAAMRGAGDAPHHCAFVSVLGAEVVSPSGPESHRETPGLWRLLSGKDNA